MEDNIKTAVEVATREVGTAIVEETNNDAFAEGYDVKNRYQDTDWKFRARCDNRYRREWMPGQYLSTWRGQAGKFGAFMDALTLRAVKNNSLITPITAFEKRSVYKTADNVRLEGSLK